MKTSWSKPLTVMIAVAGLAAIAFGSAMAAESAAAGDAVAAAGKSETWRTVGLGATAALAVGMSVLGAGYAVGRVGSAALGTAAERPELLTRSLLFVALAEGLAVLGFAIAMMLVQKI